jgi:hypothetical protein
MTSVQNLAPFGFQEQLHCFDALTVPGSVIIRALLTLLRRVSTSTLKFNLFSDTEKTSQKYECWRM